MTCRRHLCGVSSEAGLSPAPLPPWGNKKTTEVWLSREGGRGGALRPDGAVSARECSSLSDRLS